MKEDFSNIKSTFNTIDVLSGKELKTEYEYYAICSEDTYYIKKGQIEKIPNEKEALKAKEIGKYKFIYSENMHWDDVELNCIVIKKEIKYSVL